MKTLMYVMMFCLFINATALAYDDKHYWRY